VYSNFNLKKQVNEEDIKNLRRLYPEKTKNESKCILYIKEFIRKLYGWMFYPFIIFPIAYLLFSIHFVYIQYQTIINLNCIYIIIVVLCILVIFFGYFYVIYRNIKFRQKTFKITRFGEYKNRIEKAFLNNKN